MGLSAWAVLAASLVIAVQAFVNLYLMLYTWGRSERMEAARGPTSFLPPRLSFTALLPARREEAVIHETVKKVWAANYPSELMEIVVVCHEDDEGTIAEARRAVEDIGSPSVRVETFSGAPINKPRGLNVGLGRTSNEVVTIFDAEDDVHPDVFNVANTVMIEEGVGVLQSGVQLMNFRDHWFSAHNCLEYFFYFKSRLHFHSKVGMIFLGGNTCFFRRNLLERVGGWDETCLTEDAEIGLRLSALGERIRVVYDPQRVTREETPDSAAAFVRQRTRWHQGFLQILAGGAWRGLDTAGQKILAVYTLVYSVFQALVILLWPLAVFGGFLIEAPLLVSMASFLPLYTLFFNLLLSVVAAFEFAREYGIKLSVGDRLVLPVNMAVTMLPFQFLLGFSGIRAVYRMARNQNNWEKTEHFGAHRRAALSPATAYETLLEEALDRLGAERGSVMVLDPARRAFFMKASRGMPAEVVGSAKMSVGEGVVGWVARSESPVIINGHRLPDELYARLSQPGLKSSIVLPVEQDGGGVAVVSVSSEQTEMGDDDLRWFDERANTLLADALLADTALANAPLDTHEEPDGRGPSHDELGEYPAHDMLPPEPPENTAAGDPGLRQLAVLAMGALIVLAALGWWEDASPDEQSEHTWSQTERPRSEEPANAAARNGDGTHSERKTIPATATASANPHPIAVARPRRSRTRGRYSNQRDEGLPRRPGERGWANLGDAAGGGAV